MATQVMPTPYEMMRACKNKAREEAFELPMGTVDRMMAMARAEAFEDAAFVLGNADMFNVDMMAQYMDPKD